MLISFFQKSRSFEKSEIFLYKKIDKKLMEKVKQKINYTNKFNSSENSINTDGR